MCNIRSDDHRSELKNMGVHLSFRRNDAIPRVVRLHSVECQGPTNRKQPGRAVNYTFVQLENY